MKLKLAFLMVLSLMVYSCNRSSPSNPISESGLRGKEYNLVSEVSGYEDYSSFSTVVLDDSNQFMLKHYKSAAGDLIVLEGTNLQSDGSKKTVALDFLQFSASELANNFVIGGRCKVGTEDDPQLIGLFSMDPPTEGDASIATKVWRADPTSGKIIPIELKGVLFYNEIGD